jgi:hypothetical protein
MSTTVPHNIYKDQIHCYCALWIFSSRQPIIDYLLWFLSIYTCKICHRTIILRWYRQCQVLQILCGDHWMLIAMLVLWGSRRSLRNQVHSNAEIHWKMQLKVNQLRNFSTSRFPRLLKCSDKDCNCEIWRQWSFLYQWTWVYKLWIWANVWQVRVDKQYL